LYGIEYCIVEVIQYNKKITKPADALPPPLHLLFVLFVLFRNISGAVLAAVRARSEVYSIYTGGGGTVDERIEMLQ
jgi:hypothetical protein